MVGFFGQHWRMSLRAFRPTTAVGEGLRAEPETSLIGALEDAPFEAVGIFDPASDAI